jgi:hypothetical protein
MKRMNFLVIASLTVNPIAVFENYHRSGSVVKGAALDAFVLLFATLLAAPSQPVLAASCEVRASGVGSQNLIQRSALPKCSKFT